MREFIKNIIKPEKITKEELARSVEYVDQPITYEDKVNLYIKPDGTPMLVDRFTGKILWKKFEFDPRQVEALKEEPKKSRSSERRSSKIKTGN